MLKIQPPYSELYSADLPDEFFLFDHIDGFDKNHRNRHLDQIQGRKTIFTQTNLPDTVKRNYPNLTFVFDIVTEDKALLSDFQDYKVHPELRFTEFLCSFNRSEHVGRQLLVSALSKFDFYNDKTCSKSFGKPGVDIFGHVLNESTNPDFYSAFFDLSDTFNLATHEIGDNLSEKYHTPTFIQKNIYELEDILTSCFIQLVSESIATSYVPFVTEKFLYSVVTRGLFLAYAQPGWHRAVSEEYGFRLYDTIFDYRFDSIQDPVQRLVELLTMLAKFKNCTQEEWKRLYNIEQANIEFNIEHYYSKGYMKNFL